MLNEMFFREFVLETFYIDILGCKLNVAKWLLLSDITVIKYHLYPLVKACKSWKLTSFSMYIWK